MKVIITNKARKDLLTILDKHYRERICEKFRIIYYVSEKEKMIFIGNIINGRQYKKMFFDLNINQII